MDNIRGHSEMAEMIKVIGVMANQAAETGRAMNLADVAKRLNEAGYESTTGDDYSRVDMFIREAYKYYSKSDPKTAGNIKEYFFTRNGGEVIYE